VDHGQGTGQGSTEYFPVLANSLPNGVLEELILSARGKPFTPELSEIMDSLYWWAKTKNLQWYEECIVVIDGALSVEDDRMEMLQAIISVQVRGEVYFGIKSMAAELLCG
jgi:hypothetical protein